MLSTVRQDLSFALRQFRRSPGFAVTAALTLGLGIGATTAIFSLVDGILLRPLPFPHADQLVAVSTLEFPPGVAPTNLSAANYLATSYPNLFDWQRQNHTFASLASYDEGARLFSKANGEGARVIPAGRVSANLFPTLGVTPALGRNFTAEEEQAGHRVVILSHELWVSDFGASPDAIGQTVRVSDWPSTVVGVMPAGFHYPIGNPAYFWATYAADNEGSTPNTSIRDRDRLAVVGRLKGGVGIAQALAELNTIQRGLAQQYSEDRYKLAISINPLLDDAVADVRSVLILLFAAVGVLLLIGCANVAGLLLARANARRPEVALRTALGASRIRVVRQLFMEALLLAVAGGVVGILASYALLRAGLHFIPTDLPRLYSIAIDGRVLAFAVLLSATTALIFGLLPAWKMSHSDPATALREGGLNVTFGRQRNRLHHALVVTQTALGFTLLIGSGLLIRSMVNILHIDPGFDAAHTVFFDVALTNKRYPDPRKVDYYKRLLPELAALPGVESVSSGHPLPIQWGSGEWTTVTIANHLNSPDDPPGAGEAAVMPGYFEALSIPLLRGRTFNPRDNDPASPPVAVINRSFAQQFFPAEDPMGQYFTPKLVTGEPVVARQIIGVVGNTRTSDMWNPYQPQFFLPYGQDPTHQRTLVVMKVAGDPRNYETAVRRIVATLDEDAPVFDYRSFAETIQAQAAQPRFEAVLVAGFAAIALLLSALGLYAVLSYVVSERIRELGLRIALGASRSDILSLVLRRALILATLGIGIGASASIFAARLITNTLFQVAPLDRSVFLAVTLVLILVSMIAALMPALRAARVDPIRTLREQ
ncbi:MAG TPA: ABC transporter permease [Candidatus Sulfotelmatobacter sp.]|nr:ABC transporter permease [Candidatus Sulfotelmatobacter sp.]